MFVDKQRLHTKIDMPHIAVTIGFYYHCNYTLAGQICPTNAWYINSRSKQVYLGINGPETKFNNNKSVNEIYKVTYLLRSDGP